ncbi:MAG: chemotaxis protein CheB, partial [Rhodospirillales bacterium]
DSEVVATILEQIYNEDARLEVVSVVRSGEQALERLKNVAPDVISLDIRLPGMDGIEVAKRIMEERPTPIVVVAASVDERESGISMNALRAGALAVVEKPVGMTNSDYDDMAAKLCRQLVLMSDVNLVRRRPTGEPTSWFSPAPGKLNGQRLRSYSAGHRFRAIGIAASTGGPNALVQVLGGLPADVPVPIMLVQHMTPSFLEGFVDWLAGIVPQKVVVAANGERPVAGTVYVAPPDRHLCVVRDRLQCVAAPHVAGQRPSGTVLLETMARNYGTGCIGIVLTGMGSDGARGLKEVFDAGGYTIVEDETTSIVFGMPGAAVSLGAAAIKLPLPEIADHLTRVMRIKERKPA